MSAPQFCVACLSTDLTQLEGAVVCNNCGTQALVQLEEAEYEEVGGSQASRRRIDTGPRIRLKAEGSALTAEEAAERLQQQADAYLHCLQALLQNQCEVLPDLMGVTPEVATLVRSLWFLLLPHTELLDMKNYICSRYVPSGDNHQEPQQQPNSAASGSNATTELEAAAAGLQPVQEAKHADEDMTLHDVNQSNDMTQVAGSGHDRNRVSRPRTVFHYNGTRVLTVQRPGRSKKTLHVPREDQAAFELLENEMAGQHHDTGGPTTTRFKSSEPPQELQKEAHLISLVSNVTSTVTLLAAQLHPQITLVICLLACILLKQPITPLDIIRAALAGQLPFLKPPDRCFGYLAALLPSISATIRIIMMPGGCGNANDLLIAVTELAGLLQLELPLVNGPLLLYKAAGDLALPEAVWMVSAQLYELYFQDTQAMALTTTTAAASPYVLLAALLIVATRMCYGLDGSFNSQPHFPSHLLPSPPMSLKSDLQSPYNPSLHATGGRHKELQGGIDQPSSTHQATGMEADNNTHVPQQDMNNDISGPDVIAGDDSVVTDPASIVVDMLQQGFDTAIASGMVKDRGSINSWRAFVNGQRRLVNDRLHVLGQLKTSGWQAWSRARIQEYGSLLQYPTSASEAAGMEDTDLVEYLKFLRLQLVHSSGIPEGLQELDTLLQQLSHAELPVAGMPVDSTQPVGVEDALIDPAAVPVFGTQDALDLAAEQVQVGAGSQSFDFGSQDVMMMGTQEWGLGHLAQHYLGQGGQTGKPAGRVAGQEQITPQPMQLHAPQTQTQQYTMAQEPSEQAPIQQPMLTGDLDMGPQGALQTWHMEHRNMLGTCLPQNAAPLPDLVTSHITELAAGTHQSKMPAVSEVAAVDDKILADKPWVYAFVSSRDTALHPDLMAVVAACSVYMSVQPRTLIRVIALIEKHMMLVERSLSTGRTSKEARGFTLSDDGDMQTETDSDADKSQSEVDRL